MSNSSTNGPSDRMAAIDWRKVIRRISILIGLGMLVSIAIPALGSRPVEFKALLRLHPAALLIALLLSLLPVYLHAWTIWLWGRFFRKGLTGRESVNIAATSVLGSAVTPTIMGGAPLKIGLLAMHRFRAGQAAAVTSLGSLQDILAFAFIIIASVLMSKQVGPAALLRRIGSLEISPAKWLLMAALLALLTGICWLILTRSKWGARVVEIIRKGWRDFIDSFKLIGQRGKAVFISTALINIVRWLAMLLVLPVLLAGLGLGGLDLLEAWSQQWLVITGMTVTPMPGGAGGAEALFFLVYDKMVPAEAMVVLTILWRFFTAYFRVIFCAILVVVRPMQVTGPSAEQ